MDKTILTEQGLGGALLEELVFNFQGCQPQGKLIFGFGVAEKLGSVARELVTEGPALILAGRSMVRLGVADKLAASLRAAGISADIFSDIEPEPHIDTMLKAADKVKSRDYRLIVGVGGGSVLDTAKMAALFATSAYDPMTLMKDESLCTPGLPSILLPTTSGTGSEVSPFIVISDEGDKFFVDHPCVYGTVALVDPLLCVSMPAAVTAFTGLDALSHGVEGVCGKGMDNPYSLALSTKCVELIFKYLRRAVANPNDLEARYYMAFASVLGMMAYIQGGGLYAHSMSYVLTKHFGKPHGFGCGVTLPYTLAYNEEAIRPILDGYGLAIFGEKVPAERVIDAFRQLALDVGMPRSLREIGMTPAQLPLIAEELVVRNYRRLNPRDMSPEEGARFVKAMLDGELYQV